jgi:DUF1009 family protein
METIGLIAGNGVFPVLFAREAKARGLRVVAVAHVGETVRDIEHAADSVEWIRVGQIAKLVRVLRRGGVRRAVMAGGIDKVRSLSRVRPDWRAIRLLARAMSRGDDAVLRALADELAREHIEIVPSTQFLDRLLFPRGIVCGAPPDDRVTLDLRLGVRVLRALGDLDVGQSVIVEGGVVLAIEAIEGTDAAIRRAGAMGRRGSVLIKAPKRSQDMRFDVPATGPATIRAMSEAGVQTLACESGGVLLLEADETVRAANRHGISVLGFSGAGDLDGD